MKKSGVVTLLKVFAWILVFLAFAFIFAFIVVFIDQPLSKEMSAWGELGSYGSFIVSVFNLVCFIILTYKASEFEEISFSQQMLTQKIELQTDFRKSHIETVRQIMLNLNTLTCYDLNNAEDFSKFKRECESLRRIFIIFETNKNVNIVGACNYSEINKKFEELSAKIDSTDRSENDIWNILNDVNIEIVKIEKQLSDYTLQELESAFSKTTAV